MWSLLSPYLLLTLALGAVLSWTYAYNITFGYCSEEEPFLTLRNIPVQTCVTECQLRNACMAVNYWRQRRDCEMLLTDEGPLIQRDASKQVCTFIRKSDVHHLPSLDMTACLACNKYTVCNVSSNSCVIKECRKPTVPNASIKGNMLTVGSHIMIDCNQWFVGKARSTCQDNGNWSNIPTCVFEYASSCDKYLVTGPDGVADNQLSASSFWCENNLHEWCVDPDWLNAKYARLNQSGEVGSWTPADPPDPATDYIQVDFLTTRQTTGIVLNGRAPPFAFQYVTAFRVGYSLDCTSFTFVQENGNDKSFVGSSYAEELVTRMFEHPIQARCIRINPTACEDHASLRFDVLGC